MTTSPDTTIEPTARRRRTPQERRQEASDKAAQRMAKELLREAERDRQRQMQEDGLDFICGLETEGAARFGAEVARRVESAKEWKARGDGAKWKPKPTVSDAVRRKQEDKAYKSLGMKKYTVRTDKGEVKEVWCFSTSYRAMGFQDHQIHAAEQFSKDWETAYPSVRSASLEPSVDNAGRLSAKLHRSADAHCRLMECKKALKDRAWEIVVAVAVHGANVTGMTKAAGVKDSREIRRDIDNAFDDLAGFYSGGRRKDKTWAAFEDFNRERAAMIEAAEREVG